MWALLIGLFAGIGSISAMAGGRGKSEDAPSRHVEPEPVAVVAPEPEPAPIIEPAPVEGAEPVVDPQPAPPAPPAPEPEPQPEPQPEPPAPDPQPANPAPEPQPTPDPVTLGEDFSASAMAGRVTTLELPGNDIAAVKILSGPEYGNVTVNPDNTLAVVLSGTTDTSSLSFQVEATAADGTVTTHEVNLDVSAGTQGGGWGLGDFYMLETDADDDIVVEHGENHRKVYISGDDDALTLADIAAIEGLDAGKISGSFLRDNPEYGATENMALAEDAGTRLWKTITGEDADPSSNWLLVERGYEYGKIGDSIENGTRGESEINPIYVGAYGTGDAPVISDTIKLTSEGGQNIVVQGLNFSDGFTALSGGNILLDDLSITSGPANVQNIDGFTLRNSDITDVVDHEPRNGDSWSPKGDRESGIFVSKSSGILIEDSFFDHNGWEESYDPSGSAESGQPPSIYSHNVYLQKDNLDITFRDNITMRGASFGAQVRPGGFIEDNIFLDNNAGVNFLRGGDESAGNYTLFTNNIVTSGGHRAADAGQGGLTFGVTAATEMASLVDNIVAHLADPNNPDELADKEITHDPVKHGKNIETILYDNTIIYNWAGSKDHDEKFDENNQNIEGLDHNILDQTTIQIFTANLLGKPDATITDLADYLRVQADGQLDHVVDADLIIEFFQTGFGLSTDLRGDAETLRFVPDDLGDGMRWDNRLNWTTDDLPGTQNGDSVDLGGNWVQYGGTTTIENLGFGEGGMLNVTHGYLQVDGHISVGEAGATLDIDNSGQFWTDGYTDKDLLTINAEGGRFANTGLFTGRVDLNISDNAQAILASDGADFVLDADSSLHITGDDVKVGFDGDQGGTGVLLMADNATLGFTAEDGELGQIREFYSGAYDDGGGIQSGVNLGNSDLFLDLTGLAGGDAVDEVLIQVDEVIGNFDNIEIVGLGNRQDAFVTIDYEADTVTLSLGATGDGTGKVKTAAVGDETDAQANADLWDALTNGHGIYPDDPPADIPDEDGLDQAA